MRYRVYNLGGKQLKVSPFLANPGEMLRCVNMENDFYGAKKKRPGYAAFLGTANGSSVIDVWSWTKEDGTSTFVYRNSGGRLYYYNAGIGTATTWSLMGNGTITAGNHCGHAVLADTMFVSQVGGTTRHTTNGTSLTDTTGAPGGEFMTRHQNRIHIGSASTHFWSAAGAGTDWATSGTSDSSSQTIPGPGKINAVFTANDKATLCKNLGNIFRWDGYNLVQVPTDQGPSSPYSLAETEDYWFWLNRNGIFGYNGDRPELLSAPIQRQLYNHSGSAIAGTTFDMAPGGIYRYDYYLSVGNSSDDLTKELTTGNVIKYDYQTNQLTDFSFYNAPTTWTTYKDKNGDVKFIFGADTYCFSYGGTVTADHGQPIDALMEGVLHFDEPEQEKYFKEFWAVASPGCGAKVQVAIADSFSPRKKKWIGVGQFNDGIAHLRFPGGARGRLLFWRISESSTGPPFTFYGFTVDFDKIGL